jgi:hypothetical protein
MSKLPVTSAPRDWPGLIAFLAVLVTAVVLIIFGHMTAGGLTTVCAALVGLYAAFKQFGPVRDSHRPPSSTGEPEDEAHDRDA